MGAPGPGPLFNHCVKEPNQANDGAHGADDPPGLSVDRPGQANLQRLHLDAQPALELDDFLSQDVWVRIIPCLSG